MCGKRYEIPREKIEFSKKDNSVKYPKACSKECSNKLRHINLCKSMIEKYGHENASQCEEFAEKKSKALKASSHQARKKREATMMQRYGVKYPMQSETLKSKIRQTNIEKYGTWNPAKNDEIKIKISERLKDPEVQAQYLETSLKTWEVHHISAVPESTQFVNGTKNSLINQAFAKLLDDYRIEYKQEFHIPPYFYDFYLPKQNVLIEIDPTYTHSTVGNHWGSGIDKNYHKEKSEKGLSEGHRVIHIFDWDNKTEVINSLICSSKVYARNCKLESVKKSVADTFLNENHLQGTVRGQSVIIGLYYNGKLVQLMSFGKPRYNSKYEWELLRLCTKRNYKVIGGASKLFTHFVKDYNPASVISYCDSAKFDGSVYTSIGMTLDHITQPAKVWSKGKSKITDNLLRARGYDQLFRTSYGKDTSNEELMLDSGWLPVYDCGQKVFEWHN